MIMKTADNFVSCGLMLTVVLASIIHVPGQVCLWSTFITKVAFYWSRLKSKMNWHFGPNTCLKCKSMPQRGHYLTVDLDCVRKRIHSLSC